MAQGQLTYLNLVNRVLQRLGKAQVVSADFAGLAADSWGGLVKDFINDAQREVYKEHDWTTLFTTATFTTSSRTHSLSTSISDFGREVSLVDTSNDLVLVPVAARDIDQYDPDLDDAGTPTAYAINYPNLLFNRTPSSVAYRLRYLRRPTALSAVGDLSILPEYCDLVLVAWAVWQLAATREDAADYGKSASKIYQETLGRAIGQDRRTTDRVLILQPTFGRVAPRAPRFPSNYERGG